MFSHPGTGSDMDDQVVLDRGLPVTLAVQGHLHSGRRKVSGRFLPKTRTLPATAAAG